MFNVLDCSVVTVVAVLVIVIVVQLSVDEADLLVAPIEVELTEVVTMLMLEIDKPSVSILRLSCAVSLEYSEFVPYDSDVEEAIESVLSVELVDALIVCV